MSLIGSNTTIHTLSAAINTLHAASGKHFALNTTITSLDLGCNRLRDEGACALALNTTITKLDLSVNKVVGSGLVVLAGCTNLKALTLEECVPSNLGDEEVSLDAVKAWAKNTTLKRLELRGYYDFAKGVLPTCGVQDLVVSGTIYTEVAQAIASNTSITRLEANTVWDKPMGILAEKQGLEILIVKETQICAYTALALAGNPSLVSFRIERNLITSSDAAITLVVHCTTLLYVGEGGHKGDIRERIEQNQQRVKDTSHVFIMACELMFGMRKAIRKRLLG